MTKQYMRVIVEKAPIIDGSGSEVYRYTPHDDRGEDWGSVTVHLEGAQLTDDRVAEICASIEDLMETEIQETMKHEARHVRVKIVNVDPIDLTNIPASDKKQEEKIEVEAEVEEDSGGVPED